MKPIFRNAMFGFHKEDVAHFIAKQNKQFEIKFAELKTENENAENAFKIEKQALQDSLKALEADRDECLRVKEVFAKVRTLSDSISEKTEKIRECSQESLNSAKALEDNSRLLSEELKKANAFREKAKKFDRLAGVLSEIFSGKEADRDAGEVTTAMSPDMNEIGSVEEVLNQQNELIGELLQEYQSVLDLLQSVEAE